MDEPVGFEEYTASSGVGSGTEHALYADRQGSVIWVTEPATGQVVAGYEYDGYGQLTQTAGTLSQPYGYTGREYDAESGLYHYRARAYDPAAGVFVQSDPIEFGSGQTNIAGYVANDPFNQRDPAGLQAATADGNAVFANSLTAGTVATGEVYAGATDIIGKLLAVFRAIDFVENLPAAVPGSSAPDNPPPGNCNQEFYSKIHDRIKRIEQLGTSCKGMPAGDIWGRSAAASRASQALFWRSFLANICLGNGGDKGHREAIDNLRRGIHRCFNVQ